jgi:hypothetical protein
LLNSHRSYLIIAVNFTFAETGYFFLALNISSVKFVFATQKVSEIFFLLDLYFCDYQLPLRDQPKYARFKGAENHGIYSIDSVF